MRSYKFLFIALCVLFIAATTHSQVQVSQEPYHKPVLVNNYIRLLDVWLQPNDTTAFHIHSTPSVFLHFSATKVSSQVKGDKWVSEISVPGKSWYRSFIGDTLIHRVCNRDTVPFHVTDIEILLSYKPEEPFNPLPFDILYENEKVIAYQVRASAIKGEVLQDRGPLVAEMVTGEMLYNNIPSNEKRVLKSGEYLYIGPGTYFSFTAAGTGDINLVLFELK